MSWNVEADGYFIVLPEWIEELEISPQAFRLWCRLAKLANIHRGQELDITRQEMVELMGVTEKTLDRWVKELEDAQALKVLRSYDVATKRNHPNRYRVQTQRPAPALEGSARGGVTDYPTPTDSPTPGVIRDAPSSVKENNPPERALGGAPSSPSAPPSSAPRSTSRRRRSERPASGAAEAGAGDHARGSEATKVPPASTSNHEHSEAADKLARSLFASAARPLSRNVRVLRGELVDVLGAGWSPEEITAAALGSDCIAWTFGGLTAAMRKAETARRPDGRRPKPAPPVHVAPTAPKKPLMTEEERAQAKAMLQARRDRKAAERRAAAAVVVPPVLHLVASAEETSA